MLQTEEWNLSELLQMSLWICRLMCLNRLLSDASCMQGVPTDFLTRNEQYVNASTQQKPSQVGTMSFLGTTGSLSS